MTPASTVECGHCSRPVKDGLGLCTTCTDALVRDLRAVPGLVDDLGVTRAGQARTSSPQPGGRSADTPLPIRVGTGRVSRRDYWPIDERVAALGLVLLEVVDRLERAQHVVVARPVVVRALVDLGRGNVRDPAALTADAASSVQIAAVWLAEHPLALRRLPDVLEVHDRITDAVASARMLIDIRPPLAYRGRCDCGTELYALPDVSYLRCPRCLTQYESADLRDRMLTAVADQLVPAHMLSRLLQDPHGEPVNVRTIRSWHARGQLTVRAWAHGDRVSPTRIEPSDQPLFRVGDAQRLASREDPRMTIVEFLTARLREDEALAVRMRDAVWPTEVAITIKPDTGDVDPGEPRPNVAVSSQAGGKDYLRVWAPSASGESASVDAGWRYHESAVVVWSAGIAARMLAEVAAKRAILADYTRQGGRGASARFLAGVYADHPDFDRAWRL
jgi:hypothetical protein